MRTPGHNIKGSDVSERVCCHMTTADFNGLVPFRLQAIRLRAITPTGTVSPTVSLNWICMRAHMPRACAIALVPHACSCVLVDIWRSDINNMSL